MKTQINIRKMTEKDLDAVVDVWKEMMIFHAQRDEFFNAAENAAENFAEYMKSNIADEKCLALVAEDEKQVVGYCLAKLLQYPPVFEVLDYGELSELAIAGNYRRSGIGQALFKRARSWLESKAIKRIEVRAVVTNEVSTAFWRKMGFTPYVETLFLER